MSKKNVVIVETKPGKKGQLQRHGVKRKMMLVSINGNNVTQLMFEEIILLLRTCVKTPKMLVFNMKMGEEAVIKKTLVGFRPKKNQNPGKQKIGAAQSFRKALKRRKNDPLWIYKHDFEDDVIDNLKSKMEERKLRAALLLQRMFRARTHRRELEAKRSYDVEDIDVIFRQERFGIRFEDLDNHHPLHLPKDSRRYDVCVTDFDPKSECADTVRKGDLLISADGTSFADQKYDQVLKCLSDMKERPIRIKFRRYKRRKFMQRPTKFMNVVKMMDKLRMGKETAAIKLQTAFRGYQNRCRLEAERCYEVKDVDIVIRTKQLGIRFSDCTCVFVEARKGLSLFKLQNRSSNLTQISFELIHTHTYTHTRTGTDSLPLGIPIDAKRYSMVVTGVKPDNSNLEIIHPGDLLICADTTPFTDLSFDESVLLLRDITRRPLCLIFRRYQKRKVKRKTRGMIYASLSIMKKIKRKKLEQSAAVKLQAAYRGHVVRNEFKCEDVNVVIQSDELGIEFSECTSNKLPFGILEDAKRYSMIVKSSDNNKVMSGDILTIVDMTSLADQDFQVSSSILDEMKQRPISLYFKRYTRRKIMRTNAFRKRAIARHPSTTTTTTTKKKKMSVVADDDEEDQKKLDQIFSYDVEENVVDDVARVEYEEETYSSEQQQFEGEQHSTEQQEAYQYEEEEEQQQQQYVEEQQQQQYNDEQQLLLQSQSENEQQQQQQQYEDEQQQYEDEQEQHQENVEMYEQDQQQIEQELPDYYTKKKDEDELVGSSVFIPVLSISSFSETPQLDLSQQKLLPQLETQSQMRYVPDSLMQSLLNKSERTTRMRHNKDTLRAFLKWHDRRDRPIFTLRRRPDASADFSLPPLSLSPSRSTRSTRML